MASNTAQTNTTDDPVLQWVTFRLAGETYGINVMQVQEVLRHSDIAPVPGAPPYVLGIINLRGNVVTVIDTRNRFGLESGEIQMYFKEKNKEYLLVERCQVTSCEIYHLQLSQN